MRESAAQVLALLERGDYATPSGQTVSIADAQAAAVDGTRLLTPDHLRATLGALAPDPTADPPPIEVTGETTQLAAGRLCESSDEVPGLLNFASARNHGGGFLNGASAQEEDLCRCSGLYPCLLTPQVADYYTINRRHPDTLYTDHLIYSPAVPFFRLGSKQPMLEAPLLAGVLTAPAPNTGPYKGPHADLAAAFERRTGMVLAAFRDAGHRTIVLGAWGCGAFQGDPVLVADVFARWLADPRFAAAFDRVVFAVLARGKLGKANLAAFQSRLT